MGRQGRALLLCEGGWLGLLPEDVFWGTCGQACFPAVSPPPPHLATLSASTSSRDPGLYLLGRGQLHTCQCRWPGLTPGPFSSDTQAHNSGAQGGQED